MLKRGKKLATLLAFSMMLNIGTQGAADMGVVRAAERENVSVSNITKNEGLKINSLTDNSPQTSGSQLADSTESPSSTPVATSNVENTGTPDVSTGSPATTTTTVIVDSTPTAAVPETTSVESGSAEVTPTPAPGTFKASFPDDSFRKIVNEKIWKSEVEDKAIMTETMAAEIAAYEGDLVINNCDIVNLKGIEYFTGIDKLDCSYNQIQILDLSKLSNLKEVMADYNDVLEVNIPENSKLEMFSCSVNALKELDISNASNLKRLMCRDNQLEVIKFPVNSKLTYLDCSNNRISAISFSDLPKLEAVYCHGNSLLDLDVSNVEALKYFSCVRSNVTLKMKTIGNTYGVALPEKAVTPSNISDGGALDEKNNAIVWSKLSGVPSSFTYEYKVKGFDYIVKAIINVDKSDFVDKITAVDEVKNLTAKSKAYNKITLSWDPVDNVSGYKVYRSVSNSSGFSQVKDTKKSSTITFTNSGTACGTKYYYKVRAYRKIDGINYYGGYSAIVQSKSVPAKVTGLKVAKYAKTKNKINLTYKKVAGASGYRIYRSTKKTTGFTTLKTVTSGSKLSYVKAVKRKVNYYYKVRAYTNVSGKKIWGAYSAVKAKKLP